LLYRTAQDTVTRISQEETVLSIIEQAGWPIWPLIIASIISLGIIGERLWSLRGSIVAPKNLLPAIVQELQQKGVSQDMLSRLANGAPLARVFAAALRNVNSSREIMKESIEEEGRAVAHELERFLTSLGTIATAAPLWGLFGTVIGMVEIFAALKPTGGSPADLAHGISIALYNTASGLIVAIPSLVFYRHFRAKIDALIVEMEQQAVKLVEVLHGERK
jgi:biopolymer transport protein ExbB